MQSLDVDLVGSISGCGRGCGTRWKTSCLRTNTMDLCFPLSGLQKHSAYVALSKTYFVVVRLHYIWELGRIRVVIFIGLSEVLGCMNKLWTGTPHWLQTRDLTSNRAIILLHLWIWIQKSLTVLSQRISITGARILKATETKLLGLQINVKTQTSLDEEEKKKE